MLARLSGRTHRVLTAVGLHAGKPGAVVRGAKLFDSFRLGQPVVEASLAQDPTKVLSGSNPKRLCAHINTLPETSR